MSHLLSRKFEPDCLKIDRVMAIFLGKRILAGFFNRPVATATAAAAAVNLTVQIDVKQSVVTHQRVWSFPSEFTMG